MRFLLVTAPLLASASLAACSNAWRPPEIKYDDTPRQAVLRADPPKPVKIVELPKPLPLPGQLKPLPGRKTSADPADPATTSAAMAMTAVCRWRTCVRMRPPQDVAD